MPPAPPKAASQSTAIVRVLAPVMHDTCHCSEVRDHLSLRSDYSSNKCHASSNKCLTSSNKKLLVTSATLPSDYKYNEFSQHDPSHPENP